MFLDLKQLDGINVLSIGGELGGPDDDTLIERVNDLLNVAGDRLILDLHSVTYLNSTGLNTLVRITARANVQEQRVVLAHPAPLVDGVLRTTQLVRFFEVFADLPAASAALRG